MKKLISLITLAFSLTTFAFTEECKMSANDKKLIRAEIKDVLKCPVSLLFKNGSRTGIKVYSDDCINERGRYVNQMISQICGATTGNAVDQLYFIYGYNRSLFTCFTSDYSKECVKKQTKISLLHLEDVPAE